jgi:fluoride exporter
MKILLLIGAGSFIGGISRFLMTQLIQIKVPGSFPFGTMSVNILGSFLIGFLFAWIDRGNVNAEWKPFLITGILGGFTTFSAFSAETLTMMKQGQLFNASAYVAATVIVALFATMFGFFLHGKIFPQ